MVNFKVISINGLIFECKCDSIFIPTIGGEVEIFENHMSMLSLTNICIAVCKTNLEKNKSVLIINGIVEILNNFITIICDSLIVSSDIKEEDSYNEKKKLIDLLEKCNINNKEEINKLKLNLKILNAKIELLKINK